MGGARHVIAKCLESMFTDIENFGIFPSMLRVGNMLYQIPKEDYSNN